MNWIGIIEITTFAFAIVFTSLTTREEVRVRAEKEFYVEVYSEIVSDSECDYSEIVRLEPAKYIIDWTNDPEFTLYNWASDKTFT